MKPFAKFLFEEQELIIGPERRGIIDTDARSMVQEVNSALTAGQFVPLPSDWDAVPTAALSEIDASIQESGANGNVESYYIDEIFDVKRFARVASPQDLTLHSGPATLFYTVTGDEDYYFAGVRRGKPQFILAFEDV